MANATSTQLQELYVAYFGRAADPTGLDYWTEKGISTAKFAADMYAQAEFKDAYGSLSTEAQVNQIYKNLFDREADVTGLNYWTLQINLGELKLAEIANHLVWAAQNNDGSEDDKTALTNRTNAAIAYTAKVAETTAGVLAYQAQSTDPWVSGDNIKAAISYLSGIDKTTAHTDAGVEASVLSITTTGVPAASSIFKLTTGIDNFTGGAGNDSFTSTNSTLQANDSIVGGAGTDSLDYVDSSTDGTAMPAVALTDIENITVRNLSGNAATAGSAEVGTVTTGALKNGQYITVAGETLSATADATAAQVATALAGGTVSGLTLTGTLTTGFTKAAGTNSDDVTYTASTVGNKSDLEVGGNSGTKTSFSQKVTIAIGIRATDSGSFTYNGSAVTTAAFGGTNVSNAVTAFVNSLNSTAGKTIAYASSGGSAASLGSLVIVNNEPIVLAGWDATNTTTTLTPAAGAGTQTIAVGGTVAATGTISFLINGDSVTTAAMGTSLTTAAAAIAATVNTWAGQTISTASGDDVTIDSGNYGTVLTEPAESNGTVTFTLADTVASGNILTPDATVISTVNGVAASNASSNTQSVDTSQWTGVNQYKNFASTNALTFASVAENDKLIVAGVTAGAAATTDIQYSATVVKGDSTVGTLELDTNTNAGTITIGDATGLGIETLNITATGKNTIAGITSDSAKTVTLTADAATDVTISTAVASAGILTVVGAGKVTLNTLDTGFDTVEASGNSGGIVVTDAGDVATVYTLGTGADTFTTAADNFATSDKFAVNAGDGTDVLAIAAAADMDTAAEANRYTNFETLSLVAGQDTSLVSGITAITAAAMTSQAITGINTTSADAITFTGTGATTTLTLANATGSSDSLTIDLKSATSTTNVSATALAIAGVETLNVVGSTGTAATDSDITYGTADVLTAVNFSGTADMTMTAANITKKITFNSTSTGDITLTGNFVTGGSFTTGTGKDLITTGTNNGSTYNTGAGDDTITAAVATLVATGSDDTTLVAGDGTDTLAISDAAPTVIDNHFTNITGVEKMTTSTGDTSITTGAAFKSAFADSATITSGTLIDSSSFVYSGGLYDKAATITIDGSLLVANATGENITVTTGSGNDTVKTGTDATYTGALGNGSAMSISTGAGDDTIEFGYGTMLAQTTTEAMTITGGAGVDSIKKTGTPLNSTTVESSVNFVFADGDSVVGAYDTITGYTEAVAATSALGDLIDVGTGATVGTSIGSTDFGTLLSHSLAAGEVSFDDAATWAAAVTINSSNLADVTGYLNANLAENTTVSFEYDNSGNGNADSTFIFTNLAATASSADTLILLKDTIGAGISATATLTTNDYIIIG